MWYKVKSVKNIMKINYVYNLTYSGKAEENIFLQLGFFNVNTLVLQILLFSLGIRSIGDVLKAYTLPKMPNIRHLVTICILKITNNVSHFWGHLFGSIHFGK